MTKLFAVCANVTWAVSFALTAEAETLGDLFPRPPDDIGCELLPLAFADPVVLDRDLALFLVGVLSGAYQIRNAEGYAEGGVEALVADAAEICAATPNYSALEAVQMTGATRNWMAAYDFSGETDPAVRRLAIEQELRELDEMREVLLRQIVEIDALGANVDPDTQRIVDYLDEMRAEGLLPGD